MLNSIFHPKVVVRHLKLIWDYYLIRLSGLFDKDWYLNSNPDVARAKVDPIRHYLTIGGFEGRDPSPNFNSLWYLNTYEDVKLAGMNPLVHYLKLGKKEGRKPLSLETDKIQEENDLSLLRSSGLFDDEFYLKNNPDIAKAGIDPLFHYYRYGGMEGRDPSPGFDSRWYLAIYKDVKQAGVNPLVHYLKFGKGEGRQPFFLESVLEESPELSLIRSSGLFDETFYLKNNPDVVQFGINPLIHYYLYGGSDGCAPGPNFSSRWYLDEYDDIKQAGVNPLVHYLQYGKAEGRRPTPTTFALRKMYDYARQTNRIVFKDTSEQIYLNRPRVIGSFNGILDEGEAECPQPYVAVLNKVVIVGGESLVMTEDEIILNDDLADFHGKEFGKKTDRIKTVQDDMVTFKSVEKPSINFQEGIFLSCGHDDNYFHWLVECLPKLLFIDNLVEFKGAPLLIPSGLHKNLITALERININKHPVLELEVGSTCQVEKIIVPSSLSRIVDRHDGNPEFDIDIVLSHRWLPEVSQHLKSAVAYNGKPWRKIFISRKKGRRLLANHKELEYMLLDEGFEIVDLEGVSLDFQIKLFSQAAQIVAPSGAALTNMLFCQPGTKVTIFMPNASATNYYFWSNLGAIFKQDVTIIAGERLYNMKKNHWPIHDDYVVDTQFVLGEIKRQK